MINYPAASSEVSLKKKNPSPASGLSEPEAVGPIARREDQVFNVRIRFILAQPRRAGFPCRYSKLQGIKPNRFRIPLKMIKAICENCEIGGFKIQHSNFHKALQGPEDTYQGDVKVTFKPVELDQS